MKIPSYQFTPYVDLWDGYDIGELSKAAIHSFIPYDNLTDLYVGHHCR